MSRPRSLAAFATLLAVSITPTISLAQGSPLAEAFRNNAKESGKNLVAAAEVMPEAKYVYKPTPAQMSFGEIVVHLIQGNDLLCGAVAGTKAPARSKIAATDTKATLVARLRETFQFCDQSLASLDDSKLTEQLPMFGRTMSRAAVELVTVGDWADHYSQMANYLRLNNLLPPTAKK
jgi:DinB superfamily